MFGNPQDNTVKEGPILYLGMAICKVAGVNVDDATFKRLMGFDRRETFQPVKKYQSKKSDAELTTATFEVIFETVPALCGGISKTFLKNYIIKDIKSKSPSKGTVEVIDKYGRNAWVTPEEMLQTNVPELLGKGKNGVPFVRQIEPASMRQAYKGESEFMAFLSNLMYGEDVSKFEKKDDKFVYVGLKPNASEMECRIDNIEKLFNGINKEVLDVIKACSNNMVKVAVGIRSHDGKAYNTIHDIVVRPYASTYKIESAVHHSQQAGYDTDIMWDFKENIHAYSMTSKQKEDSNFASSVPEPVPAPVAPKMQEESDLPF